MEENKAGLNLTAMEGPQDRRPEEPVQDPAAMERELNALREQARQRELVVEAKVLLEERGIEPQFVPFVLGENSAATRRKVEQFEGQFNQALSRHLASHLPSGEPRDFSIRRPGLRRPGIRRI